MRTDTEESPHRKVLESRPLAFELSHFMFAYDFLNDKLQEHFADVRLIPPTEEAQGAIACQPTARA